MSGGRGLPCTYRGIWKRLIEISSRVGIIEISASLTGQALVGGSARRLPTDAVEAD
jgi:hypothetical protein